MAASNVAMADSSTVCIVRTGCEKLGRNKCVYNKLYSYFTGYYSRSATEQTGESTLDISYHTCAGWMDSASLFLGAPCRCVSRRPQSNCQTSFGNTPAWAIFSDTRPMHTFIEIE